MKQTAEFSIRYIYKENGGKHTALNVGVQQIISELTFIVDSDDALVPNAIETVLEYHRKMECRIGYVDILFLDNIRMEKSTESYLFRMKR